MKFEVKNITKSFKNGLEQNLVLNNVNLILEQGESVCLTGSSGSGKSTLLSIMGGLEYPDFGSVCVDDIDIYKLSEAELSKIRRERFGFIFQQFNLIPSLSAKENICLPLLFSKKKIDEPKLFDLCEILGIRHLLNRIPSMLSGGEQQRVAIARALFLDPSVIFADEPTGNLDQKNGEKVIFLLQKLTELKNNTLILVTHDIKISSLFSRQVSISNKTIV